MIPGFRQAVIGAFVHGNETACDRHFDPLQPFRQGEIGIEPMAGGVRPKVRLRLVERIKVIEPHPAARFVPKSLPAKDFAQGVKGRTDLPEGAAVQNARDLEGSKLLDLGGLGHDRLLLQRVSPPFIYHGKGRTGTTMTNYLDFEKPLAEIEGKAEELRAMARANDEMDVEKEAAAIDKKAGELLTQLYTGLSPWRKCQVARHPDRPHCKDYIEALFTEYTPLAGDRNFADDHAVMGGLARFEDRAVMVIGHEKGHDTKSRIERNFGMARPEGYRKAIRLMDLADRFGLPVITLVDTPGAYPGKGAEERGQSEAIARSTQKCLQLSVPLVSIVIGEGGSGGAVAFATANRLAMLEHSIYSVISPEGCASILWKDAEKMREAAEALRLTAQDLKELGVCDRIVSEPVGGAHRHKEKVIKSVGKAIAVMLAELSDQDRDTLRANRRKKYLGLGSKGLAA